MKKLLNPAWGIATTKLKSNALNKGIYTFDSPKEAVEYRLQKQIEFATAERKPENHYSVVFNEFPKPKLGLNMMEYCNFVANANHCEKQPNDDGRTMSA